MAREGGSDSEGSGLEASEQQPSEAESSDWQASSGGSSSGEEVRAGKKSDEDFDASDAEDSPAKPSRRPKLAAKSGGGGGRAPAKAGHSSAKGEQPAGPRGGSAGPRAPTPVARGPCAAAARPRPGLVRRGGPAAAPSASFKRMTPAGDNARGSRPSLGLLPRRPATAALKKPAPADEGSASPSASPRTPRVGPSTQVTPRHVGRPTPATDHTGDRPSGTRPQVGARPLAPRPQGGLSRPSQQFKSPHPNAGGMSEMLRRKLAARKRFVPWGMKGVQMPAIQKPVMPVVQEEAEPRVEAEDTGPPPGEPLVLWEAEAGKDAGCVEVDPMLTRWLREHQREGVKFMFECVCGLRSFSGNGCILADDMGLGKTLQGISLLWTLLKSGHAELGGSPIAKRIIIVCPTSLVNNWDSECEKWLKGRVRTLPLCESSRDDVIQSIAMFLSPRNMHQVLIVSYETFRLHADRFKSPSSCDLLICDEAHRLKNDATLTNQALDSLACKRRVLLSGTPLQNHLDEFYAMVNFCNPGLLGPPAKFRKYFEAPIVAGREPDASDHDTQLGQERMAELNDLVGEFILRRTNSLLSQHLPPKVIEIVCCKPTELQHRLYCAYLESKAAARLLEGKASKVLAGITALKKLCNHPKLVLDMLHSRDASVDGFEDCMQYFLPWLVDDRRGGSRGVGKLAAGWENLGGKFAVLAKMLALLRQTTNDRIVIVSNYTQTLDLVAQLCREHAYPFVRLDGTTTISKRQKLVKEFNDPTANQFAFLLSSKAGGCGLNLIGGNRLVLFDPDWNPANDKQAAGRVWRDGQKKRVFVYQRQLSKEGLQSVVNNGNGNGTAKASSNLMSQEELRNLFQLRPETVSDTYDSLHRGQGKQQAAKKSRRKRSPAESDSDDGDFQSDSEDEAVESDGEGEHSVEHVEYKLPIYRLQVDEPAEEDLKHWAHNSTTASVPDRVMRSIGDEHVSFIFSCNVSGKALEGEQPLPEPEMRLSSPLQSQAPPGPRAEKAPKPEAPKPARAKAPSAAAKARTRAVLESPAPSCGGGSESSSMGHDMHDGMPLDDGFESEPGSPLGDTQPIAPADTPAANGKAAPASALKTPVSGRTAAEAVVTPPSTRSLRLPSASKRAAESEEPETARKRPAAAALRSTPKRSPLVSVNPNAAARRAASKETKAPTKVAPKPPPATSKPAGSAPRGRLAKGLKSPRVIEDSDDDDDFM
eukprot:jgi/Tetstr1/447692/TSEL_035049.t1